MLASVASKAVVAMTQVKVMKSLDLEVDQAWF